MIALMMVSPIWGQVVGVFSVLTMASFIGIWIWAWRKHHKSSFDRLARLPLEDDIDAIAKEDRP